MAARFAPSVMNPQLHGRPLPLMRCLGSQPLGYGITVEDKPIEHQRKVNIGDAPRTELALGGRLRLSCEGRIVGRDEYNLGGALLPKGQKITAKPGLNLTRSRSALGLRRVERRVREDIIEILGDGGGL